MLRCSEDIRPSSDLCTRGSTATVPTNCLDRVAGLATIRFR